MMTKLLTAPQVAEFLRVDTGDVLGMVADGELVAALQLGDELLIAEGALREFIAAAWVGEPYVWGGER